MSAWHKYPLLKKYRWLMIVMLVLFCFVTFYGIDKLTKNTRSSYDKTDIEHKLLPQFYSVLETNIQDHEYVTFKPNSTGVYIFTHPLTISLDSDFTVEFHLLLEDWESIQYISYGWETESGYVHTKLLHPPQDTLLIDTLSSNGYWLHIHNDSKVIENTKKSTKGNIKFFIKGIPDPMGAKLSILDVKIEDYMPPYFVLDNRLALENFSMWYAENRHRLLTDTDGHYYQNFLHYLAADDPQSFIDNADHFLQTGEVQLDNTPSLEWIIGERIPSREKMMNTHRYLWHALYLPQSLLLAYQYTGETKYLYPVPNLITHWLENNVYITGDDQKYIWYDHGVADRLMVLIHAWHVGLEQGFDVRFMQQLANAIYYHSDMLSNRWFYAYNQSTPYHNHAVFQDIALLSAANLFPILPASDIWEEIASARLYDQFHQLVTNEGVLIENSYGYHEGLTKICYQIIPLFPSAKETNTLSLQKICDSMQLFSDNLAYPDGRKPSFGDSHHYLSSNRAMLNKESFLPKTYFYPESGYFVAKGMNEIPWQLNFIAPSITKTHKHADNLNITFWAEGVEWLIDPGYYSHEYSNPVEAYARGPHAHNVPFVPNRDYSLEPGLATLTSHLLGQEFVITGESQSLENATIKRTISGDLESDEIIILDEVEVILGSDEMLLLPLHLGKEVEINRKINNGIVLTTTDTDIDTDMYLTLSWDDSMSCEAINGNDHHECGYGWIFPEFKEKVPTTTLLCQITNTPYQWSIRVSKNVTNSDTQNAFDIDPVL